MLPPLDHSLAIESSGDAHAPFRLEGGCTVIGSERDGISEVLAGGRRIMGRCAISDARCMRFRITPLGVERRLLAGGTTVTERIVVSPLAAAFAIEWLADSDGEVSPSLPEQTTAAVLRWSEPVGTDRVRLRAGIPLQLIASARQAGDAGDPADWIRILKAASLRRALELLHIDFAVNDLNAAVEWATFRIVSAAPRSCEDGRALIGIGDFRTARSLVATTASDDNLLALLPRYFAATGDDAFTRDHWPRALAALAASEMRVDHATARGLRQAAEAIGDAKTMDRLTQLVPSGPGHSEPWTDFAAGNSVAAASCWRRLAALCFEGEKGNWPYRQEDSAGHLLTGLVYGMLGCDADAARGRLRLRPQLPEELSAVTCHNISMGDARVQLEYQHVELGWHFALAQSAGAYPVRLIFEPTLPAVPTRVLVDGKSAQLDLVPFGERVVAPIQIMLDERRRVEFYC